MNDFDDKIQIVAFSTNDTRQTPNDIIDIFLGQHVHSILKKNRNTLAFSTILRNSTTPTNIMICSILNLGREYTGINDVNCYLLFIDLEKEESAEIFESILSYIKDFCESSKKMFVLGMGSEEEDSKYMSKYKIAQKLDSLKINFEYKEINLNKIKEVSEIIMDIIVYCQQHSLNEDSKELDKDRTQFNSCFIF